MRVTNITFTTLTLLGVSFTSSFTLNSFANVKSNPSLSYTSPSSPSLFMTAEESSSEDASVSENKHEVIEDLRSKISVTRGKGDQVRISYSSHICNIRYSWNR